METSISHLTGVDVDAYRSSSWCISAGV